MAQDQTPDSNQNGAAQTSWRPPLRTIPKAYQDMLDGAASSGEIKAGDSPDQVVFDRTWQRNDDGSLQVAYRSSYGETKSEIVTRNAEGGISIVTTTPPKYEADQGMFNASSERAEYDGSGVRQRQTFTDRGTRFDADGNVESVVVRVRELNADGTTVASSIEGTRDPDGSMHYKGTRSTGVSRGSRGSINRPTNYDEATAAGIANSTENLSPTPEEYEAANITPEQAAQAAQMSKVQPRTLPQIYETMLDGPADQGTVKSGTFDEPMAIDRTWRRNRDGSVDIECSFPGGTPNGEKRSEHVERHRDGTVTIEISEARGPVDESNWTKRKDTYGADKFLQRIESQSMFNGASNNSDLVEVAHFEKGLRKEEITGYYAARVDGARTDITAINRGESYNPDGKIVSYYSAGTSLDNRTKTWSFTQGTRQSDGSMFYEGSRIVEDPQGSKREENYLGRGPRGDLDDRWDVPAVTGAPRGNAARFGDMKADQARLLAGKTSEMQEAAVINEEKKQPALMTMRATQKNGFDT